MGEGDSHQMVHSDNVCGVSGRQSRMKPAYFNYLVNAGQTFCLTLLSRDSWVSLSLQRLANSGRNEVS